MHDVVREHLLEGLGQIGLLHQLVLVVHKGPHQYQQVLRKMNQQLQSRNKRPHRRLVRHLGQQVLEWDVPALRCYCKLYDITGAYPRSDDGEKGPLATITPTASRPTSRCDTHACHLALR